MLEGGAADPQSPANKLADKRYANFVAAFDFAAHGEETTSRDVVQNAPKQFVLNTGLALVRPDAEFVKAETDYYKANIGKVKSIEDLLGNPRLLRIAMSAYGLNADTENSQTDPHHAQWRRERSEQSGEQADRTRATPTSSPPSISSSTGRQQRRATRSRRTRSNSTR